MKRMKQLLCACLTFLFCLFLPSCALLRGTGGGGMPDTVQIEGKTYRTGFYGELYAIEEERVSVDEKITLRGEDFYPYRHTSYPCYVAFYRGVTAYIYCEESVWEAASAYYEDPRNYSYLFLRGNVHDPENRTVYRVENADPAKYEELFAFVRENEYAPFGAAHAQEKSTPNAGKELYHNNNQIRFYTESLDGCFTSYKAPLHIVDGRLVLLHYYDNAAETMHYVELPEELNSYFLPLLAA